MKQTFTLVVLLFSFYSTVFAQSPQAKTTSSIADATMQNSNVLPASLTGVVTDTRKNILPGASVTISGTDKGINANEYGRYFFNQLRSGKINLRISLMGYKTQSVEVTLQPGQNKLDVVLAEDIVHLNPVTVIAQKRTQQLLDVPTAITVVGADFINKSNITELGQLSTYVPGLFITEQGANRPSFIIRGLSSEEVSPSAQPRVSVFLNSVPINRANGASVELFDMERVEVLKGPQNSLFGRGAQIGAIHFISKGAENATEGYATAGIGNYNQKEFRGAINVPVLKNKLFVRAAGVYNYHDGFVENTFGGTLNGKNTVAGRLSARYLPAKNHKLELVLNYQHDDTPGIAFMSRQFPNAAGDTTIFNYRASLEQGKNLHTGKKLFDATLNYKFTINEHTSWTSITSYRKSSSSARWDGDGTAAPAIDMAENTKAGQFYQEIRYNYSLKGRLNGSAGASYWNEKADQTYWFSPNEQSMVNLFFNPAYLIMPNGQPLLWPALPSDPALGPLAGMPLPESHQENNFSTATNQATEAFVDLTYQITKKLYFSGGFRAAYEKFELSNEAAFIGGLPSTLGMMTGNYPNLFFKPSAEKSMYNSSLSANWQAGLQYRFNEHTNVFANYSNGRRPKVLQYTSSGTPEVLDAEVVNNIDLGVKTSVNSKLYIDVVAFYQKYSNFQSRAWVADTATGDFNYNTVNGGKATSYGVEALLKASLLKELEVFGNYAYLHATFDDNNSDGSAQEYAGNTFRLSPEHSFSFGLNAHMGITPKIQVFITPSFSYKTHFYFEDANTKGLEQEAFGLLNVNLGVELADPRIIFSIYSTNLLDTQFITSAGNTGSLFGVPTFVPGSPRMIGSKVSWRF